MRRMSAIATLLVALSWPLAQPVQAAPQRDQGMLLWTARSTSLQAGRTLTYWGLEIYTDGVNAQIHLSRAGYALNGPTQRLLYEEFGTVNLDASALVVGEDLSFTLPPVAGDLYDCDARGCTFAETVEVGATFAATSPISTLVERTWDRADGCTVRTTTTYEDVLATMTLDFDGVVTTWDEAGVSRQTWESMVWGCDA